MESKNNKIIIGLVGIVALALVAYIVIQNRTPQATNINEQSNQVNQNLNESASVKLKSFSDANLSFEYPGTWGISEVKNAPTDNSPYPCGVIWNKATKCIFVGKDIAKDYSIGMGVFQSAKDALTWCKDDEYGEYSACQAIEGSSTMVSAVTPSTSSPKYDYRILSKNGKIVIMSRVSGSMDDFELVVKSVKIK